MSAQPLSESDAKRIQAAQGWLELGNFAEAHRELDAITPASQAHLDTLTARLNIYAQAEEWDRCLALAEIVTDQFPKHSFGWLALAATQHKIGDTKAAYETLSAVIDEFKNRRRIRHRTRALCLPPERIR